MGILKSFFFCKDINKIIKTGYILQDPSTPCYGEQNHGTYQEKQGQTKSLSSQVEQKNPWHQMGIHMKECRISNEHIRAWFLIIPPIDHFLTRRTWRNIGKVVRSNEEINVPRKTSCHLDLQTKKI